MTPEEKQEKLDALYKTYREGKLVKSQPKLTEKDLMKLGLMEHINGIAQVSNNNVVVNHLIDLKLLIDKI